MRLVTRWDLDKTYLRTEFDSLRDLVRTALESPEDKRTNPGALTLLRELSAARADIHILSGSPEQMRGRLEKKLRLDGIRWESFNLKPNLQNMLRLRFRAVRDQLGYKFPALLRSRRSDQVKHGTSPVREVLLGDDAEADAFVYSLYADTIRGMLSRPLLREVLSRGRMYSDVLEETLSLFDDLASQTDLVDTIYIHLESQTPPDRFQMYGSRVVPFYNYMQVAYKMHERGDLSSSAVFRVGCEFIEKHRFDGETLGRSYADLARRGHLNGTGVKSLVSAFEDWRKDEGAGLRGVEMARAVERIAANENTAKTNFVASVPAIDYLALVRNHNPRKSHR